MRKSLGLLAAFAVGASLAPAGARAHGVAAEVDQREGAVSVRARYHGGRPLADARYEIESPRGGAAPFAEGRTDRHGWLAFTPDVAGKWTVRIADASGHGKTVEVVVASVVAAQEQEQVATGRPPHPGPLPAQGAQVAFDPRQGGEPLTDAGGGSGYLLRVLAGVTAIVVVFRLLLAVQRARRAKGR